MNTITWQYLSLNIDNRLLKKSHYIKLAGTFI